MNTLKHNTTGKWHWQYTVKMIGVQAAEPAPPMSNFDVCFELPQEIQVPYFPHLLLYVFFIYIYLHKNNIKMSLISIRQPPFYSPYPVAGIQAPLLNRLHSSFLFFLLSLTSLKMKPLYSCACVHSCRLLLLIITLVLCKRKNNEHDLSTLFPPEFRDDLILMSVYTAKPLTMVWLLYYFHFGISL